MEKVASHHSPSSNGKGDELVVIVALPDSTTWQPWRHNIISAALLGDGTEQKSKELHTQSCWECEPMGQPTRAVPELAALSWLKRPWPAWLCSRRLQTVSVPGCLW